MKAVSFLAMVLMLLASSCHHAAVIPTIEIPIKPSGGTMSFVRRVEVPEIRLAVPDLNLDLRWLDLEGFYPPHVERIEKDGFVLPRLAPENRARFPSTEVSVSPDQEIILFHDGTQQSNRIYHRLLQLRKGSEYPTVVYGTTTAFDVTWAPDSRNLAVTNYVGKNSSQVTVVKTPDQKADIPLREIIEQNFPPHFATMDIFVKAYRWTEGSDLVIRAVGRAQNEPFDILGCEAIVDLSVPLNPIVKFTRGYIKRDGAR